jgi:hypothetical protein
MNLPFDDDDYKLLTPTQRDLDYGIYFPSSHIWSHMHALRHDVFHNYYSIALGLPRGQILHTCTNMVLCFHKVRDNNYAGTYDNKLAQMADFIATINPTGEMRIVKARDFDPHSVINHSDRFREIFMEYTAPASSTMINNGDVRPNPSNRIS